eukprot:COSAG01_NODE_65166_length_274_cov_0.588571_1_plen_50_part_10
MRSKTGMGYLTHDWSRFAPAAHTRDCDGNEAPIAWVGDGHCDKGIYAVSI